MKLPPVQIDARVVERTVTADETCYKVSVRNASAVPAVQVWLEVIDGDQGDEVLPAFWSDNALNLMPNERRELTVRFRAKVAGQGNAAPDGRGLERYPAGMGRSRRQSGPAGDRSRRLQGAPGGEGRQGRVRGDPAQRPWAALDHVAGGGDRGRKPSPLRPHRSAQRSD